MTEEIELIKEIEAFCKRHSEGGKPLPESTFGRRVLNNPSFMLDLRDTEKPRSPTGKTTRKIRTWMKNEDTKLRRKTNEKDTRESL